MWQSSTLVTSNRADSSPRGKVSAHAFVPRRTAQTAWLASQRPSSRAGCLGLPETASTGIFLVRSPSTPYSIYYLLRGDYRALYVSMVGIKGLGYEGLWRHELRWKGA